MATGYTKDVASGKVTDFKEYALLCARNFGACITMRDDPLSSEIPEFEVNPYCQRAVDSSVKALADFVLMSAGDREKMYREETVENLERTQTRIHEIKTELGRYEEMLDKALQYEPPTPEHEKYAEFLVEQLRTSIKWDCDLSYYEDQKTPSFSEWKTLKLESLSSSVNYAVKGLAEEKERVISRNDWVSQLKKSLEKF